MIPRELMTEPQGICADEIDKIIKDYSLDRQQNIDFANRIILVDLDSTLSDSRHRSDHIHRESETDWEAYALASGADLPIGATVALVDALADSASIFIVSGRHKSSQEITEAWLEKHDIQYSCLALCPDTGLHVEWKVMWRDKLEELGYEVLMLIDDHPIFREAMAPTPVVIIDPGFY